MEPLSWALWELVRGMSALDTHLASAQLQIFARGLVSWMDQYDVIVAPALAEAPVALDDVHWQTDDPMGLFTRSGAFTPFTAVANVTRPAGDRAAAAPSTRACRWACSSSGARRARATCWPSPRSSRRRGRGSQRRPEQ